MEYDKRQVAWLALSPADRQSILTDARDALKVLRMKPEYADAAHAVLTRRLEVIGLELDLVSLLQWREGSGLEAAMGIRAADSEGAC